MKLHKIFLFAATALATAFASCSSDEKISVGEQDSTNKPFAYMDADNVLSYELDPADPTEITFKVCRSNTSEAAMVPLNVAANTDDVFQVPAAVSFTAGSAEATVKVTFPNAEVGKPYTLKVGFTPEYAGIYKDVLREQAFTITRVKWNDLGIGTLMDGFWYGGNFDVKIQQRDDNKLIYRFENPYTNEFVTAAGETCGTYNQWITLTTTKAGGVSWGTYFFINTMYDADHEIYALAPSYVTGDEADDDYSYVKKNDDGTIQYIDIAPYWYMFGLGGWGPSNGYTLTLFFPGQLDESPTE